MSLVTIGIASYNSRSDIDHAIESALSQTWSPCEIVVVDDASTDGTPKYLSDRYGSRIRLFALDRNQGIGAVRNKILAEANGEFLAFFDDDDKSSPDRVERQRTAILQYEAANSDMPLVVCHCARTQLYPDGTSRTEFSIHGHKGKSVADRILFGRPLSDNAIGSVATCSQMARMSTYRALGGFDPALRRNEDTDFSVRLAQGGGGFVGVREPLVTQRMTPGSEKSPAVELACWLQLLEKHRAYINERWNYKHSVLWIKIKYESVNQSRLWLAARLIGLFVRFPMQTFLRALWAMPNVGYNRVYERFQKS